jgi:3-phenylpropionate/trans-cinnamate dioxygenase ferredoxin reductase component
MPERTVLIVGASLAGAKAAETLRAEGFDGRVVLVGDEHVRPYERPPLSKDYLRGEATTPPFVHDEAFYATNDIELRLGQAVTEVSTADARVTLEDGEVLAYDRLLLSTGAEPRRLPVPGIDLPGVHELRSLVDADVLRERLAQGHGHLVVVGAGWIGCEVAASARQKGLDVTVIEPQSVPLERVLGQEVGSIYARLHLDNGVNLLCGEGLAAFEGTDRVERVRTASGAVIDCDFVVVGVGVAPRTALASAAGLTVDNGVVVDAGLRSSAPNVFAAGDVANAYHPFYGRHVRVEHWANALEQGKAAGPALLGRDVSYDHLPYFYSDQYDTGMEYRGHTPDGFDRVVFRGDPGTREFIAFWCKDDVVQAAMNFNVWDVGDALEALIRARRPVDAAALADAEKELPAAV